MSRATGVDDDEWEYEYDPIEKEVGQVEGHSPLAAHDLTLR